MKFSHHLQEAARLLEVAGLLEPFAIMRMSLLKTIGLSLLFVICSNADAAERIVIELDDGRLVSGEIDSRTDDERLWLRTTAPSIVLTSSWKWTRIVRAHRAKTVLTSAELRAAAAKLKSDLPPGVLPSPIETARVRAARPAVGNGRVPATDARVRSLHITAVPANWDDDAEDDGLRVEVLPLDARGRVLPINGRLSFKLTGRAIAIPAYQRRIGRFRSTFPEIGSWSQAVKPEDFGPHGAVYNLPFRNIRPQFDSRLAADALLYGRLSVSRQGVFEASDAHVELRRLSRFRDELQLHSGRRILRSENPRQR